MRVPIRAKICRTISAVINFCNLPFLARMKRVLLWSRYDPLKPKIGSSLSQLSSIA